MSHYCDVEGCINKPFMGGLCHRHHQDRQALEREFDNRTITTKSEDSTKQSMSQKYPKYYKPVGNLKEVDVYQICNLFGLEDASGAIHHAVKKLLLSGVRTGGKTKRQDIMEARDTLNRWLDIYPE